MRRVLCMTAMIAVWLAPGSQAVAADRRGAETRAADDLFSCGALINQTWTHKPGDAVWSVEFPNALLPGKPQPTDDDLAALEHFPGLSRLSLAYTKISDRGLDHIKGCKWLAELDLWATPVTDAGLERLARFTKLSALGVGRTKITDDGLAHLKKLRGLQRLELNETDVGDQGLTHLADLTEIRILRLDHTRVTDAGLAHLEKMAQLERLDLNNTTITDKGLAHLKDLEKLRFLDLRGTKVTDQGVAELRKVLPGVTVRYKPEPPLPQFPRWFGPNTKYAPGR